jgi:two-component system nitrate/nitrite response regulator NarL
LIEDHTLVRQLLAALVREHLQTDLAGEGISVNDGITLARRLVPDLMVVDWSLPDGNAADLIQSIVGEFPTIRWLIVSSHDDETVLRSALALGVHGIVLKQSPLETFLKAMKQVLAGGSFYCPRSSRLLVESLRSEAPVLGSALTLREREILRGLSRGLNLKEIADLAGCSVKTVQNQTSQLKDKLGIRDPAGLILYAQRNGLLASNP